MAKKKGGSGKTYSSKGERPNCNQKIKNLVRNGRTYVETQLNKMRAFAKGRNVVLTIPNPNPNETNRRFIRVNAKDVYGDWRNYGRLVKVNDG